MNYLKYIYLLPYWTISIFSTAKSYRNNPIIGSSLLNRLGLHVFRVVLSHGLYYFRLLLLSPLIPARDRKQFREQGYLIKENFLPPEQFSALCREIRSYRGGIREIIEGTTETQRLLLTQRVRQDLPVCDSLVNYSPLDRLMRYAGSKNRPPLYYVENIKQHAQKNGDDPQKDCHMDTFHPCVKAWLYLDEVTDRNGPFCYVPGSHRLTWKRLKWEYRQSLLASADNRQKSLRYWDGASRVSDEDLGTMGFGKPTRMEVAPNTLLLANVRGFHCRGNASEASTRLAIWMQARDNPFNPFITPFPRITARLFEKVWEQMLRKKDASKPDLRRHYDGRFDRY